jgi:hypothetical protein
MRTGVIEDPILDLVNLGIDPLDNGPVLSDQVIQDLIQKVVRTVPGIALVLPDSPMGLLDSREGRVVMGHHKVASEEDIQLHDLRPRSEHFSVVKGIHDHVEIVAPVIDLGDVRFLEGIVHSERVKVKDTREDGLTVLIRFGNEIHPQQAFGLRKIALVIRHGDVKLQFLARNVRE